MTKHSTYWKKRATRRLTDAEKQSEIAIRRVNKMYDQAKKNIERDIENIYANYSKATGLDIQSLKELLTKTETAKLWEELKAKGLDKYVKGNYKARITRLEQLQAQIYAKAKEIAPKEQGLTTACYKDIIKSSYYKAIYDTQMGTGWDFPFATLDDNLVRSVLNEGWSGLNYSKRIWGNTDILAESIAEIVGGALLSGQSIQKTSRQIRERFGVCKYYADRLIRTESNHFHNEADFMAYEEMGVEKYVFMAVLDTRTSKKCQELDNKVFELKEKKEGVNFPPMHPHCRSTTRAYMGEEIEKTLKRRARNPITNENEVIGNMSYKEWYNEKVKAHGKRNIDLAYQKAKNRVADKEQYNRYVSRLGRKNVGTLENFVNIKYNNSGIWNDTKYTYRLRRHYDKAIANGDLSALVDFDLYSFYDKRLHTELNDIKTANNITVKGHSFHFIDRVFGSVEKKRSGVDIPDIIKTLNNPTRHRILEKSIKIYGENNIVSINQNTGHLIQVNPYKK